MNINRSDLTMVGSAVVFCRVVAKVDGTRGPVDVELSMVDSVAEPVEAHVNGFGSVLFDGGVHDTIRGAVVSAQWCGWLWMA